MTTIAKLVKGGRTFDLNTSPYRLVRTFNPPGANIGYLRSAGTSANRYGGASKVSEAAANISLTVPLVITSTSRAGVQRAIGNLAAFLALGSTKNDPMYFVYRANAVIEEEPLFGQFGANSRFEIVHAYSPQNVSRFGAVHGYGTRVDFTIDCRPFILGKRQILGRAAGGVTEDRIGSIDGTSKGLSIPKGIDNLHTNPIFDSDTALSNWTTGSGVISEETTDKRFVLFGRSAVRLTGKDATLRDFYQDLSLTTGSHFESCYVKLPDGSAPDNTIIQIYFDGANQSTTTYTEVGDGWYRIDYVASITTGTISMGVTIARNAVAYVDGFQCERETSQVTAPTFGNLVGASFASTVHGSVTTRTAGQLSFPIDEIISQDQGTIRIVWDTKYSASALTTRQMFADSNGSFEAYFNGANQWKFTDGTNTATGSVNAANDHDKLIMHFVYGGGQGLKIYRDGVEEATDSTYTVPATKATRLYIGTDESITAGTHAGGLFMEFSTYDVAFTSTEVTADYNALSPLVSAVTDRAITPIPFLWTKDADDVVDNADDSTRDNWAVAGGIPGTHPAETRIDGEISPGWTSYGLFVSNFITNDIIRSGDVLYGEQQGTTDANSSGGEYSSQSVGAVSAVSWSTTLLNTDLEALFNHECYLFTRLYDAGSNLTIAFSMTANSTITTPYRAISSTSAFRLFKTDPIYIADLAVRIPGSTPGYNSPAFVLKALRTTGTANARVDYNILMPRPLLRLKPGATAAGNPEGFSYNSRNHQALSKTSADVSLGLLEPRGDRIELVPIRYNGLVSLIGDIAGSNTITHTLTYERIYVTPRWSVV